MFKSTETKLVHSATADNDDPTPGYVFKELIQASLKSSETCIKLVDDLYKRLEKPSPYVKAKVLRICKHVASSGSPLFKAELQRRSSPLRDAAEFRGPPHPVHGDALSAAVRTGAAELLAVIYDSSTVRTAAAPVPASRITGFSSGYTPGAEVSPSTGLTYGGSGGTGGAGDGLGPRGAPGQVNVSATGMVGFGNTAYSSSNAGAGAGSGKKSGGFKQKMMNKVNVARQKMATAYNNRTGEQSFVGESAGARSSYSAGAGPAPGAGGYSSAYMYRGSGGAVGPATGGYHSGAAAFAGSGSSSASTGSTAGYVAPAGEYETRLVDDITAAGGARVLPTRAALDAFVGRAASLDTTVICSKLAAKLGKGVPFKTKAKALAVMEALLRAGLPVSSPLTTHIDAINGARASVQNTVKDKAAVVLALLGAGAASTPSPSVPHAASPLISLSPSDLFAGVQPKSQSAAQEVPAAAPSPSSLFDGMTPAQPAQPSPSSLLLEVNMPGKVELDPFAPNRSNSGGIGSSSLDDLTAAFGGIPPLSAGGGGGAKPQSHDPDAGMKAVLAAQEAHARSMQAAAPPPGARVVYVDGQPMMMVPMAAGGAAPAASPSASVTSGTSTSSLLDAFAGLSAGSVSAGGAAPLTPLGAGAGTGASTGAGGSNGSSFAFMNKGDDAFSFVNDIVVETASSQRK
ncbi:uncharacterized protein AMSG_12356 [Thecamonas trahens ATCC 50062]|uniref:ENTH domain-containing protein n=1 Tax=Thecamonas trahens ATCC 50062 TaxID=461836 RepID=A0A0L0DSQ3_THETB|nr:hypothetical protein AMSG_12356 [Thecamonas trahens ATCC 50062]KNC54488.1 hypothetical protein AMSG_12356 [Thecamonas trahens ATCC 50062]|eukprot:XP_013753669.1 hypothetical protein AMSG_12356 [Thecamonas trahens ATCC 50062]